MLAGEWTLPSGEPQCCSYYITNEYDRYLFTNNPVAMETEYTQPPTVNSGISSSEEYNIQKSLLVLLHFMGDCISEPCEETCVDRYSSSSISESNRLCHIQ